MIVCFVILYIVVIVGYNVLVRVDGDLFVLEKCEVVVVVILCGRIFFGVLYGFDL